MYRLMHRESTSSVRFVPETCLMSNRTKKYASKRWLNWAAWSVAACLMAGVLAGPTAHAEASSRSRAVWSDPILGMQRDTSRILHALLRQVEFDVEYQMARRDAQVAGLRFHQARLDTLAQVRRTDAYHALKARIWRESEALRAMHYAYPRDEEAIHAAGRGILVLRRELSSMERASLDANDHVRECLDEWIVAFNRFLDEQERIETSIRFDAAYMDATRRLREARAAIAGR